LRIYTIGTDKRQKGEFVQILESYRIRQVCDVRRFPVSRFYYFSREALELLLHKQGISYIYLGDLLGGFRRQGYEAYMGEEEFRKGIELLLRIAENETTCVLCAERLPWRCHRRFIGRYLEGMGVEVLHIIEEGRLWKG